MSALVVFCDAVSAGYARLALLATVAASVLCLLVLSLRSGLVGPPEEAPTAAGKLPGNK